MKVYSLTGKSGTGKSYQAQGICADRDIDVMIDDGLLIGRSGALAGESAKKQKTRMGAIKAAIFDDENRAMAVKEKIKEIEPDSLLVLATSDRMADMIAERLDLPPISERIHIEEVTTVRERRIAERQREEQGKHVIPVPTLQLKRDFAGYFMDPMKLLRRAKSVTSMPTDTIVEQGLALIRGNRDRELASGRTVVRPTYSYMGDFIIADTVVTDIADCVAKEVEGVEEIIGVFENTLPDELRVFCAIKTSKAFPVWEVAENYQEKLTDAIEMMTAFNVTQVDVEVRELL